MGLLYFCASAQIEKISIPLSQDSVIEYTSIVSLDSTFKFQDIYKGSKTWFVNNFNSAKAVIQSEDQTNGRFLGKGYVILSQKGFSIVNDPYVYFTV